MKVEKGYTLLEVMIVVFIISLGVISLPSVFNWLNYQGVSLAVDQLRGDIQLARMMAIKRKQNCAIIIQAPNPDQYTNSLSRQSVRLSRYRGGVHFLNQGPDGRQSAFEIGFNRQGMSTSLPPRQVFLANADSSSIYRIRVMLPGGISVHRWRNNQWR